MAPASALAPLLTHAKTIVQGIADEAAKGSEPSEDAVQQLKSVAFAITSAGRVNRDVTSEEARALWDLVCLLWVRTFPMNSAVLARCSCKVLVHGQRELAFPETFSLLQFTRR